MNYNGYLLLLIVLFYYLEISHACGTGDACGAGKWCSSDSECVDVGVGYYSPSNSDDRTACGAGASTGEATSSTSVASCLCAPGYYGNAGSGADCTACTSSTYTSSTYVNTRSSTDCNVCNSGYYDTSSAGSAINCVSCATGYSTPSVGATASTQCSVCAPGYYGAPSTANTAGCVQCEVGYYKWQIGNAISCTACKDGYTSTTRGSVASSSCSLCDRGYSGTVTTENEAGCTACSIGTYQSNVGNGETCQDCPMGYSTSSTGASHCDVCGVGYAGSVVEQKRVDMVYRQNEWVRLDDDLTVVAAFYGSEGNNTHGMMDGAFVEVTSIVSTLLGSASGTFLVTDGNMQSDPKVGVYKKLRIIGYESSSSSTSSATCPIEWYSLSTHDNNKYQPVKMDCFGTYKGMAYSFSGQAAGSAWTEDFYEYDPIRNSFQILHGTGDVPSERVRASIVGYDDKLWMFGGWKNGYVADRLYSFDLSSHVWTAVSYTGDSPPQIDLHQSVVYGDAMFIWGGWGNINTKLFKYHFPTSVFTDIDQEGSVPSTRAGHSCVLYNMKMIMYGGLSGSTRYDQLYSLDLTTYTWTSITRTGDDLPPAMYNHAAVVYGDLMIVYGGSTSSGLNENMYTMDLNTYTWTAVPFAVAPPPRHEMNMMLAESHNLIIMKGYDAANTLLDDIWMASLESLHQRYCGCSLCSDKNEKYTTGITGSQSCDTCAIKHYGNTNSRESGTALPAPVSLPESTQLPNALLKYQSDNHPATSTAASGGCVNGLSGLVEAADRCADLQGCVAFWLYTSGTNAGRWCPMASASDFTTTLANGASYVLNADVTRKRSRYAAVEYQGSLYAFGGYNAASGARRNHMFRYNIDSNWWYDVSGTSGPSERTGSQAGLYHGNVYIFGGEDTNGKKNDVYKYNINSISWSTISATSTTSSSDIPSVRSNSVGVVFGNLMYVHGGLGTSDATLDPDTFTLNLDTNKWIKLNTIGDVPSAREGKPTAVLYQDKMILFGSDAASSSDTDVYVLELRLYHKWTKWTCTGAPVTARTAHGAVVHNDMMYVMGGSYGDTTDMMALDLDTKIWHTVNIANGGWADRKWFTPVVYNGDLIVYGGNTADGNSGIDGNVHRLSLLPGTPLYDYPLDHTTVYRTTYKEVPTVNTMDNTRIPSSFVFQDYFYTVGGQVRNVQTAAVTYPGNVHRLNLKASQLEWEEVTTTENFPTGVASYTPTLRKGFVYNNKYVIPELSVTAVYSLDLYSHQWTYQAGSGTRPYRSFAVKVLYKHYIYEYGGFSGSIPGTDTYDVYRLDLDDWSWSQVTTTGTAPTKSRYLEDGIVYKGSLIMVGGLHMSGNTWATQYKNFHDNIDVLNLETHAWSTITPTNTGPAAGAFRSIQEYNGMLVMWGGRTYSGAGSTTTYLDRNEVWALNLKSYAWTQILSETPFVFNDLASSAIYKNQFLTFGGENTVEGHYRNEMFSLDLSSGSKETGCSLTWASKTLGNNAPSARYEGMSAVYDNKMLIIGGYSGNRESAIYEIDLDSGSTTEITTQGDISFVGASGTSGVHWQNEEGDTYVAIFGGYTTNGKVNSLYIYDTKEKELSQPTTSGSGPSARTLAAAVYYEGQMVIQGGNPDSSDSKFYYLDLGTYAWTAVTATGATPHSTWWIHSAVEFKGKMYLFGGYDGTGFLNELYAFDLDTHVLTLMHTTGDAPSPRRGCSALMIAGNMYIFGGRSSTDVFDDLFSIELTSMQWKRIPVSGNDSGLLRYGSYMAFSDNILSVFGGKTGVSGALSSSLYQVDLTEAGSEMCGCDACAPGYTTSSFGSNSASSCSQCDRGYSGTVTSANSAGCTACDLGLYQNETGNGLTCSVCPSGYSTSTTGTTESAQCDICEQGSYGVSRGPSNDFGCALGPWQKIYTSGSTPSARVFPSGVVYKNYWYTNTGRRDSTYIQDLWRLDLDTFAWEQLDELSAPGAAQDNHLAVVGNTMLRWDSVDGEIHQLNLDPTPDGKYQWTQDIDYTGDTPYTGKNHVDGVIWRDNYWILWSGWGSNNMNVFKYDMLLHTFTQLTLSGTAPSNRAISAHVVRGDKVYIFGGATSSNNFDDVYCIDLEESKWIEVSTTGDKPSARYGTGFELYKEKYMLVFGGRTSGTYNRYQDMYVLDLDTYVWTHIPTFGDMEHGFDAFLWTIHNNHILAAFGRNDGSQTDGGYVWSLNLNDFGLDTCGCTACTAGYSTSKSGSKSTTECSVCSAGAQGTVTNSNSAGCSLCEYGKYQSEIGNGYQCNNCNNGYTTSTRGASDNNDCNICDYSYYGGVTSNDTSGCTRCMRGYSTLHTGERTSAGCNICDYGYYGSGNIYNGEGCTKCSNGYSTQSQRADNSGQCSTCESGFSVTNSVCAMDNSALSAIAGETI